tara:strand:- start:226 stop:771 length:546 start_codon:yes stop_codon:yes gene_type:complete
MGFIVEKQVDFPGGINLDSFYVRIETIVINKSVGQLDLIVGHYTSAKGAEMALPKYVEDIPLNNASATLPYEFKIDTGEIQTDRLLSFSLSGSQPIAVEEKINYEKTELVDQEVIDYDDDGNEIIGKAKKLVKIPAQKVTNVLKTKVCDVDFKENSVIEYAYSKVKNIYKEKFGFDNIKDL